MANYALITGTNIQSFGQKGPLRHRSKVWGCTYSNTVGMHNFLHSIGYTSVQIICAYEFGIDLEREVKKIGDKLQKGDRFLFCYYGEEKCIGGNQYLLPKPVLLSADLFDDSRIGFNIELIEKHTAIPGVERIILLDLHRDELFSGIDGSRKNIFERIARESSANSPIGFYYNYSDVFPPENESLFARTVLKHLIQHAQDGHEISFPAIGELISKTFKGKSSNIMSDSRKQGPCFIGDKVVILPKRKVGSSTPLLLSEEQQREKHKADQRLEKILQEHEEWLLRDRPSDDRGRLTWQKLAPLLEVYEYHGLGPIELIDRKIDYVSFKSVRFPYGTRFSGSSICNSLFEDVSFDSVDFSGCEINESIFRNTTATQCDFSDSKFHDNKFNTPVFLDCKFNDASIFNSHFLLAIFDKSRFIGADLGGSVFIDCHLRKTNFTNARLSNSVLNWADFSNSILTGVSLYGSAHTDWCIEGVECQHVFWDKAGKERFPPDYDFEEGEFSMQYRPYSEFSYTFKEGITPVDLMLATHIVDQINAADTGFKIRIDNASLRGLTPTLNFIMESGDEKRDEAQELFKTVYEQKIALLEEKLKNSAHLLEERTRRADLAEEQLSEMTAVVKQTFSGEKFGISARQLLVEHLFAPVMEEVFREDGLIAQYANRKAKGIATLDAEDLAQYRYVALFGAGQYEDEISREELDLIRTGLANFMKDECLMIQEAELRNTPEKSYLRSICRMFETPPADNAFVAIATVHPGINDKILKRPVYHELNRKGCDSWDQALNQALEKLRASLFVKSITDFSLPALPSKKQSLVCPNGNRIRTLRNAIGPHDRVCEIKAYRNEHESYFLSKNTLIKAEKGEPITKTKLEDIAKVLNTAASRLIFKNIAPNRERLQKLREAVFCTEEELLEQFGVSTPVFFDLLEEEKVIPADTLRYVHHHYNKLIGSKAGSFVELVDIPKTEELVEPL
ncbi:MAG: pentapeptide repeat-containing protein [Deltaproteobacteria bacterium]|nr:pentapeptide repeat-containing protein [Deltaproteobacteria bacterium]